MNLIPCPRCAAHVSSLETRCPHCAATLVAGARLPTVAALALGLGVGLTACMGKAQDLYGIADASHIDSGAVDEDGDGFTVSEGDCDDDNADIYPGAEETVGDGIDSNCDDADDT